MATPHDYAQTHAETFRHELHDLLRIASVSTDPAYADKVRAAADWLVDHLKNIGLSAERIETEGHHPLVYGEWLGAGEGAKTVLIYGHYDVQPAAIEDGWDTEPFEPVERDGKIYARGSTDDKGQVFAHVKALESYLKTSGALPVNVKCIIEGEEENGSRALTRFVAEHGDRLAADVCVISDGSMASIDQPVIVNALRGGVGIELEVRGPKQDLHSGRYGGTVHNPLQALAEIIAQLHHDDGSVSVPGFYDDVRDLTAEDRQQIAAVPWDNVDWAEETGALVPWGEGTYTLSERVGARPTLEITGIAGGYFGTGSKSIVPARAIAKISCRLVADQQPDDILEKLRQYIAKITPPTVQTALTPLNWYPPALVNTDMPVMQAAIAAYEKGWGVAPVFRREGGGIPIVAEFQNTLNMPVLLIGLGLDTDNLHGPNEHFSIEMFHKGIATAIHLLNEVAAL